MTVKHFSGFEPFRLMAQATLQEGQVSKVSFERMCAAEHSPIRAVTFIVEMSDCPTFVSNHFVRHGQGIQHAVRSNRVDRRIKEIDDDGIEPNRLTPICHTFQANAQALINISRKRLCGQASPETREQWKLVKQDLIAFTELGDITDEEARGILALVDMMVPECVYRNGLCPELKPCSAGPSRVCKKYKPWRGWSALPDDDGK